MGGADRAGGVVDDFDCAFVDSPKSGQKSISCYIIYNIWMII